MDDLFIDMWEEAAWYQKVTIIGLVLCMLIICLGLVCIVGGVLLACAMAGDWIAFILILGLAFFWICATVSFVKL